MSEIKLKKINDEVYCSDRSIARVTRNEIEFLKIQAAENFRNRARLCAHSDASDSLHEMLIVHKKNAYVPPHKHPGKSESFHIIEGALKVIIFDDKGNRVEEIPMGVVESGNVFFYRLSESLYHTVVINSDWAVFHEVTNGPFIREDTIFAPWAPGEDEIDKQRLFLIEMQK